jgi:hypothetical protein
VGGAGDSHAPRAELGARYQRLRAQRAKAPT